MQYIVGLTLLIAAPGSSEPAAMPKRIENIMANGDGLSPETAFKVKSVQDEYRIMAALKIKFETQSFIVDKRAYDLVEGEDETGNIRKIWFDINSFYPAF